MKLLFAFLCICSSIWCADFDCAFVGSSPFSLLEALYQAQMGKKVIVVESAEDCGGAWRTIDVCGVKGVDLGCHEIGCPSELERFLKECLNCQIVALDAPLSPFKNQQTHPSGFYFSRGCAEFMEKLKELIAKSPIQLVLNTRVLEATLQDDQALVTTTKGVFTAAQIFVTPRSCFSIRENDQLFSQEELKKHKFHHFYLLLDDPSEPRFTYHCNFDPGIYRAMNLSYFVGLGGSGRHLVIVQPKSEKTTGEKLLQALKQKNLVSEAAQLVREEYYLYERTEAIENAIARLSPAGRKIFHYLETDRLEHMERSLANWRKLFPVTE